MSVIINSNKRNVAFLFKLPNYPVLSKGLKLVQGTGNFPTDEHAYNFKLATQKWEKMFAVVLFFM